MNSMEMTSTQSHLNCIATLSWKTNNKRISPNWWSQYKEVQWFNCCPLPLKPAT